MLRVGDCPWCCLCISVCGKTCAFCVRPTSGFSHVCRVASSRGAARRPEAGPRGRCCGAQCAPRQPPVVCIFEACCDVRHPSLGSALVFDEFHSAVTCFVLRVFAFRSVKLQSKTTRSACRRELAQTVLLFLVCIATGGSPGTTGPPSMPNVCSYHTCSQRRAQHKGNTSRSKCWSPPRGERG